MAQLFHSRENNGIISKTTENSDMSCCPFDTYASVMVRSYDIHLLPTLKSFVHSIWECEKEFFPSEKELLLLAKPVLGHGLP